MDELETSESLHIISASEGMITHFKEYILYKD